MPDFTPNLNLIKPYGNENFSVSHANGNADKIDVALKNVEDLTKGNVYIEGINVKRLKDSVTNVEYYLVRIPYNNEEGTSNIPKRGFSGDTPNTNAAEIARNFANRNSSTVAINASLFNVNNNAIEYMHIYNGIVYNNGAAITPGRHILAIKDDGTLKFYENTTPAQVIIDDGYNNAITAFIPLFIDGSAAPQSIINTYSSAETNHRRQVICQFENKDYLIFTCENGMKASDIIRLLTPIGVRFAFMLDGGGSAQTVVRGQLINKASDNEGYTERIVPDFLSFSKTVITNRDKDLVNVNADLGELSKRVADNILDIYNKTDMEKGYIRLRGAEGFASQGIESWSGNTRNTKLTLSPTDLQYYDYVNSRILFRVLDTGLLSTRRGTLAEFFTKISAYTPNADTIVNSGVYYINSTSIGVPTAHSYGLIHINYNDTVYIQFVVPITPEVSVKKRSRNVSTGVWTAWTNFDGTTI